MYTLKPLSINVSLYSTCFWNSNSGYGVECVFKKNDVLELMNSCLCVSKGL